MTRTAFRVATLTLLLAGLVQSDATAWGERARRGLTVMALQVLKQDYPAVFKPSGVTGKNYERDVIRGGQAGRSVLNGVVPLNNEQEIVQAIGTEIQLLRDARKYGPTSYFTYRMGVLAALVADTMIPYGFAWTPDEEAIQAQVNQDIDTNLDGYGFTPSQHYREYLRDVRDYFHKRRPFYHDDKRLIAHDYLEGTGYSGYLKQGGRAYFAKSVEAIADVWHTVLRPEGDATQAPASRRVLAWYFVQEIEYLLTEKENIHQADKSYEHFQTVNPGLVEPYEKLGDLYYAFGSEQAQMRGVREWTVAYDMGGPDRNRVSSKLSAHFLNEGYAYLAKAEQIDAEEEDLLNALRAFEKALDFERTSQEAADRIQETNVAIEERRIRFENDLAIIASGESVQKKADNLKLSEDFGNAIETYKQATVMFGAVSEEFRELDKTAKESIRKINKQITDVINVVLDKASDAIHDGERLVEEHKYQPAIDTYDKVEGILSVIPDDVKEALLQEKKDLTAMAETKKDEAKRAQTRYENAMKEQELARQANSGSGGGGN